MKEDYSWAPALAPGLALAARRAAFARRLSGRDPGLLRRARRSLALGWLARELALPRRADAARPGSIAVLALARRRRSSPPIPPASRSPRGACPISAASRSTSTRCGSPIGWRARSRCRPASDVVVRRMIAAARARAGADAVRDVPVPPLVRLRRGRHRWRRWRSRSRRRRSRARRGAFRWARAVHAGALGALTLLALAEPGAGRLAARSRRARLFRDLRRLSQAARGVSEPRRRLVGLGDARARRARRALVLCAILARHGCCG